MTLEAPGCCHAKRMMTKEAKKKKKRMVVVVVVVCTEGRDLKEESRKVKMVGMVASYD